MEEVKQESPAQWPVQEHEVQVGAVDVVVVVVVLAVVFVVVVVFNVVVVVEPPPILATNLSPSPLRLSSNSTAFFAFHFAPSLPGTASAPVKAR